MSSGRVVAASEPVTTMASDADVVTVTIDRSPPVGSSQLDEGVTHTQYSLEPWGDPTAISSGMQLLRGAAVYQNQHLMGWGASNPEPSPGVYNWTDLDHRVALMRETGATMVITLCCAPDWMWGGSAGATDWSRLGSAPTPEHYADFAALAREVAFRYPDVKYFQVWNELKGFYNYDLNRWDYEAYTSFYNQTYDALKSVSPDIQVGGPYVGMDSWGNRAAMSHPSSLAGPWGTVDQRPLDVLAYWLANKHGADFVAVDGSALNRDGVQLTDEFSAAQKFADVTSWLRQQTNLPIWWSEWYTTDLLSKARLSQDRWDGNHQAAVMTTGLMQMLRSGVAVSLRWQPQGIADRPEEGDQESLWSDTRVAGGGQPFPFYYAANAIRGNFGPGTPLYRATASTSDVGVLASATRTLLVNQRATPVTVSVDGQGPITLAGYEVRLL